MSTAEIILRNSLAENRAALENPGPVPPFATAEDVAESTRYLHELVAFEESILEGGEPAIRDWWDSLTPDQQLLANA